MEKFTDYCREFIENNLSEYDGQNVYACDLGFTLCEGINANGTATFSRQLAKDYICEWWEDAADFSDYEEMNFGKRSNPFENTEAFMVRMIIEGVNSILSQCDFINDNWNDEIELTEDVISEILESIKDLDVKF